MQLKLIFNTIVYLAGMAKDAWEENYRRNHQNQYQDHSYQENSANFDHHYRINVECGITNTQTYFDFHTNEPDEEADFVCKCCGERGEFELSTQTYASLYIGSNHHLDIVKT